MSTHAMEIPHRFDATHIWLRNRAHLRSLDLGRRDARGLYRDILWHTVVDPESLSEVSLWLDGAGLGGLRHTITMSLLPRGVPLTPHTDFGRRSVIIVPVRGVHRPLVMEGTEVWFTDLPVLTDGTRPHWVEAGTRDRETLQISFTHRFATLRGHLTTR